MGHLFLHGLLDRRLGLGPGLMDLLLRPVQLGLIGGFQLLGLPELPGGLVLQAPVVGLPLLHELLHRLEKKEVQPAGQDGQIHPMQQNLLPVNIQRHIPHLPYNTKMIRITTSSA